MGNQSDRPTSEEVPDELPGGYRVIEQLGRGAQGRTFLVEPPDRERRLVAKQLWLGTIEDWKAAELFERSASILEELDHPGIPAYVDDVSQETPAGEPPELFLIREFAEGQSLLELIEEGWRPTEEELMELGQEVLEILNYLHGLDPPVVHRDLKPANLVRAPDGSMRLVDFGTAQARILDTMGGSTVAGTTGYVPFEQLAGQAEPASDLFALGMTLVHLASHTHPSEMQTGDGGGVDFAGRVDLTDEAVEFLEGLTEPVVEERVGSAAEALRRLDRVPTSPDRAATEAESAGGEEAEPGPDGYPDEADPGEESEPRVTFSTILPIYVVVFSAATFGFWFLLEETVYAGGRDFFESYLLWALLIGMFALVPIIAFETRDL